MEEKQISKNSDSSREVAKNILDKFFAVTRTSVYEVKSDDGNGHPVAEKIALRGESKFPLGRHLQDGTMIAICRYLVAYFPEKYGFSHQLTGFERRIEMVNSIYWGGRTSDIIALFRNKIDAMACFEDKDLKFCDPRWIKQTKDVINAIGENHPAFEVCHYENLALPCAL